MDEGWLFAPALIALTVAVLVGIGALAVKHKRYAQLTWTLASGAAMGCALALMVGIVVAESLS
jgi:hypothetical protein